MVVTVALNYSSKNEIVDAVKALHKDAQLENSTPKTGLL